MTLMDTFLSAFKGGEPDRVPLSAGFARGLPIDWLRDAQTQAFEPFEYGRRRAAEFLIEPYRAARGPHRGRRHRAKRL